MLKRISAAFNRFMEDWRASRMSPLDEAIAKLSENGPGGSDWRTFPARVREALECANINPRHKGTVDAVLNVYHRAMAKLGEPGCPHEIKENVLGDLGTELTDRSTYNAPNMTSKKDELTVQALRQLIERHDARAQDILNPRSQDRRAGDKPTDLACA
jgi:hypothetical protein